MSWHEVLRFAHLVGAIAWVGSAIGLTALSSGMLAKRDYRGILTVARGSESLGAMVFIPAALLTVGSGVAMVATQPGFRFTDLWILLGIAGIVGSGMVEGLISTPATKQVEAVASQHGDASPALETPARRLTRGGLLDAAVLLAVVAVMVLRPGG